MLDISPLIMVVTFVIFMFMLYFLNQKLYGPLLKFMDDRDASLSRSMEDAKNMSGDSGDLESKAQQTIDEAKTKAAQVRQSALDELQEEQAKTLAGKQEELLKKYESFKASLEGEKKALASKLLSELPLIKEGLKAKFGQL
jgi:F-type H+-transporting ATPase subunit b